MAVERGCWAAPEALSGAEAASFAQRVEELGYSQLWIGETLGRDPFALTAHTATDPALSVVGPQ